MKLKFSNATLAGLILSATCLVNVANAGIIVTQESDANILVDNILGSGITSSNISILGADNAFGTFTGGISAGIGIESGIMLSTGNVVDAVGPNNLNGTSTDHDTAGNAALTALGGNPTFDAATLTFDFISDGGDIFFNYVFASEEYNEYVYEDVNDVFAFFLDGSNIALIPGTDTAVSIDTVNGGNPFGTNALNSEYFNNNSLEEGPFFDIEYDGFTNVFQASFLGLSAGQHSISLQIADGGDGVFDSTVFIEASSFSDDSVGVPEPSTLAIFALGIFGLASRRSKKES
ncbi:MAG: PEP-CTERM sorting domain-containing protein [Colwellia sp.]|nr:PEP-CTERM sorting domain-containing protein [Colwellia sp.]